MSEERSTPTEPMERLGITLKAATNLARLGFPEGGVGICHGCQKEREYSHEQIIKLLMKSYPQHCGKRIDLVPK